MVNKAIKALLKNKEGSENILSFLFVILMLFILFISFVQLIVLGYAHLYVQQAAYVSARAAASHPENPEKYAVDAFQKYASKFLYDWQHRATIQVVYNSTNPGDPVTVIISYNFPKYPLWTKFLKLDPNQKVVGQATMIMEETP